MRVNKKAEMEKEMLLNPEKLRKRRKKRRKKAAGITAGAVLAFLLLAAGALAAVTVSGKLRLKSHAMQAAPKLAQDGPGGEGQAGQAVQGLSREESAGEAEGRESWQEGWVRYQGNIYAYNEDILTFLVMGIDQKSTAVKGGGGTEGGQADSLFLTVLNPHNKTVSLIGLNRNAMTDIDVYDENGVYITTTKAQLAVQHGFGDGARKSCEYQVKAVSRLLYELPIHGYAAINLDGVPTINDAVGGVEVTVPEDMTRENSAWAEGTAVHLEGEEALKYLQYRDMEQFGSADRRLARQKQYLASFAEKAKETLQQDLASVKKLYQAVLPAMTTDITLDEAVYLAAMAADYRLEAAGIRMLEGETVMGERFEEFHVDEDALYRMILNVFYEKVEQEAK